MLGVLKCDVGFSGSSTMSGFKRCRWVPASKILTMARLYSVRAMAVLKRKTGLSGTSA